MTWEDEVTIEHRYLVVKESSLVFKPSAMKFSAIFWLTQGNLAATII